MKPEEAIKIIEVAKAECEWNAPLEFQEAFDAAIDALEKQIPNVQPVGKDINVPINVNDCISRQAAIDALTKHLRTTDVPESYPGIIIALTEWLNELPSAQPEIVRCRECKFASGDSRICMKFGHSPIGELDFCAWVERRTDEPEK